MKTTTPALLLSVLFLIPAAAKAGDDIVLADFEQPNYGEWKTDGEAFGNGPARGALPGQMDVSGFNGKGLVNSFLGGDDATGTLTSPPFEMERPAINFLIGGGGHAGETCMDLLVEGKVVRTATGPNTDPGGSEHLAPQGWDVSGLAGKMAVLRIVDKRKGGWGHINVDHIVQSDRVVPGIVKNAQRTLTVTARYVHLPVKTGAPKRNVSVKAAGKVERKFSIELADDPARADWWAFLDVSEWKGRELTVEVDRLPGDSHAGIEHSDTIKNAGALYREELRPQFHFSARRGWINDPNGMVFFNGEHHLFFQHNPYGWGWGNMHWGHAVSRDMVHWKELGEALYPDEMGPMFSGGAVVDWKNSSGLGRDGQPLLAFFYTAAGNPAVQCLATSTDNGRTLVKFSGNPILKNITDGNRDPRVLWHEPGRQWIMTLYVGHPSGDKDANGREKRRDSIQFFASPDLKTWTFLSENDGYYECPDFFELPLDNDAKNRKWVLTAANSNYQVGAFDGKKFTPETPMIEGVQGRGFYAAQTFMDMPGERRVQIGWLRADSPGMPFNQCMSLPLELRLITTADGPRLTWTPVSELAALRAKSHTLPAGPLAPGAANPLAALDADLLELELEVDPGSAESVTLTLRGAPLTVDFKKRELRSGGIVTPLTSKAGPVSLRIFRDRTTVEVFAEGGRICMPFPSLIKMADHSYSLAAQGGEARVIRLTAHELKSAW